MEVPNYYRKLEKPNYWGVCVGEGKDAKIIKVFLEYDVALDESVKWTLETRVQHTVQPVHKKK